MTHTTSRALEILRGFIRGRVHDPFHCLRKPAGDDIMILGMVEGLNINGQELPKTVQVFGPMGQNPPVCAGLVGSVEFDEQSGLSVDLYIPIDSTDSHFGSVMNPSAGTLVRSVSFTNLKIIEKLRDPSQEGDKYVVVETLSVASAKGASDKDALLNPSMELPEIKMYHLPITVDMTQLSEVNLQPKHQYKSVIVKGSTGSGKVVG